MRIPDPGDLLYADGVLRVLSGSMADQVGAVDPVDEFGLCLQPLHRSGKPEEQQGATSVTLISLLRNEVRVSLSRDG